MIRTLLPLTFLAMLLAAAPAAFAQETNETKPEQGDNAWVEDCPPDMMCAYSGAEEPDKAGEPADDGRTYKGDEPTYSGECDGEVCAYGGEDCIECSGPSDGGATCMDGAQDNETCDDDVQYIGGEPTRGPADGSCEHCRGDTAGQDGAPVEADPISAPADTNADDDAQTTGAGDTNQVPGLALVGTLGALAAVGLVLRRR